MSREKRYLIIGGKNWDTGERERKLIEMVDPPKKGKKAKTSDAWLRFRKDEEGLPFLIYPMVVVIGVIAWILI